MNRYLLSICVAILVGLTGCASPIPLNNITYDKPVSVTSTKKAGVTVISGVVRGSGSSTIIPIGTVFVPIASGPNPKFQFNAQDQQAFGESLRSELVRTRILRLTQDEARTQLESPDFSIKILFPQTYHDPSFQEYTLDVVMEILGGKIPLTKQYQVVSSENDSIWEKMNTNAYEGKAKAVKLLLARLIPDIEEYVRLNLDSENQTSVKKIGI